MSLALLALLALVVAVALSVVRSDLNAGVVSIGFTFILGILGLGLTAAEIGGFFPTSLVLTLTGVTLLFEMARENGTLDRLAGYAFRAVGGRPSLLPIAVFFLTFGLAAIGPGNIAATALMAPVAMTAAERVGVRRILMAIAVCSGANAGAFSPVALTGLINANLMARIGVGDAGLSFTVFLVVAALQSLGVVGAYVLFAGWRARPTPEFNTFLSEQRQQPLTRENIATLAAMILLVFAVVVLRAPAAGAAFVLAAVLAVFRVADTERSVQAQPWNVIALVAGISMLVALMEKAGSLDVVIGGIAAVSNAGTINAAMAFFSGLASTVSSSSGVILPLFMPMIPGVMRRVGGGNLVDLIVAVDVGSHMVDVSPLSTLGALCLAAVKDGPGKQRLFRQLLAWGLAMTFVGALIAFVFLDLI